MSLKHRIISVVTCAAMALTLLPVQAFAEEEAVTVTIFTTNDIHGTVDGEGAVGIVQAAAMKASTPNALLADAGDATQGASFATISQGEDVIRMMNEAGYDVMAAGNHEFDYGTEQLLANADTAEFPILSANVTLNGEPLLPATAVVEKAGKTIGFIGLTTVSTLTTANPEKLAGVSFTDEAAAAKEQIEALKDETDAIVIISHLGNNEAAVKCTSKDLLDALSDSELSEVDAVIDGHSHTVENESYVRGDVSVPIVQTGVNSTAIGKLEITFDGEAVSASGDVLTAAQASEYQLTDDGKATAEKVQKALDDIKAEQEEILGETLCYNETPLWGGNIYYDYSEPRIVETSYGDFVTDAFAEYAKKFAEQNELSLPVIAVENGGGISASLPYGRVTRGDVLNAFNHGNMVEVYTVTPAQLKAALETGLTMTGQDETGLIKRERVSGSFMQVSGFSYTYDPSAEAGSKVVEITTDDGKTLDLSDTSTKLLLATNGYVGGTFAKLGSQKLGELGGEDQLITDYINLLTEDSVTLNYNSGGERIKIYNDKSPETYTVKIPVLASDGKTPQPNVKVNLSIDGGETQPLVTDEDGNITVTVSRGAHTFFLNESADGTPVYTNNYSGSGTVTTKPWNYSLSFTAEDLPTYDPEIEDYIDDAIAYLKEKAEESKETVKGFEYLDDDRKESYLNSLDNFIVSAEKLLKSLSTAEDVDEYKKDYEGRIKIGEVSLRQEDSRKYYHETIDALKYTPDEVKTEAKAGVTKAATESLAHILAGVLVGMDADEILEDIDVYEDKMYVEASKAYSYDQHEWDNKYLGGYKYITDEEAAEYLRLSDEAYNAIFEVLQNYTDVDAAQEAISKYISKSREITRAFCEDENLTLLLEIIPDTFDKIIKDYSDKLSNVSEDELAKTRDILLQALQKDADGVSEEVDKETIDDDALDEYIYDGVNKFLYAVTGLFTGNSDNGLNAAAADFKAKLSDMEKESGADLSKYVEEIDEVLKNSLDSLKSVYADEMEATDEWYSLLLSDDYFGVDYIDYDELAAIYDKLNASLTPGIQQMQEIVDKAAAEIAGKQEDSKPENSKPENSKPENSKPDSTPDENPDTGRPIGGAVLITLILSGCAAAAMPLSRKLKRDGKN